MKKFILSLMIGFVLLACASGTESSVKKLTEKYELATFDFGDLEFQLPKEIQKKGSSSSADSVTYSIRYTRLDEFLKQPGYMLNTPINEMKETNSEITMEILKDMLKQKQSFASVNAYSLNYYEETWKLIDKDSCFGDSIFGAGDVPSFASYLITIYDDKGFYSITISTKSLKNMNQKYPEIFNLQGDCLFWGSIKNDKRACIRFWELISSRDKNLPEELILLQDAYEIFLETLKFK